jgi:hypothetical protein
MNTRFLKSRIASCALFLAITLPSIGSETPQTKNQAPFMHDGSPRLTQPIRCTVEHVVGCSREKPYCSDQDAAVADMLPMVYELDLLKRVARLKGRDENGVVVQINQAGSMPGSNVVNVQGINEGWMPWTLSFDLTTGNGFVAQTTPGFTTIYVVMCNVETK